MQDVQKKERKNERERTTDETASDPTTTPFDQVVPNARRQRANHHPPTAPCRRSIRREPGSIRGTEPGGPSLLFRAGCFRGHGSCHGSPLKGVSSGLERVIVAGDRGEFTSSNSRPPPPPPAPHNHHPPTPAPHHDDLGVYSNPHKESCGFVLMRCL